jgi:hypothetical protein
MTQSETIAKLAEALAKAQGAMEGAVKDSANPYFKSKYADLASVWGACRKALSDNGLSVIQATAYMPESPDNIVVDTRLCHSSGEWIEGRIVMKPVKSDPQGIGSCLTYARRYALSAMVGIAPEDDDGNAASGKTKEENSTKTYGLKEKTENISKPSKSDKVEAKEFAANQVNKEEDIPLEPGDLHLDGYRGEEKTPPEPASQEIPPKETLSEFISVPQAKRLFALAALSKIGKDDVKLFLKHFYNVEHAAEIKRSVYEEITKVIESKKQFDAVMATIEGGKV